MDVTCAVEGCDRPRKARGWCGTHYQRWRLRGDPGSAGDARRRPVTICSISDCGGVARIRGWCLKHYCRWKRHGDPTCTVRNYGVKRRVRPDGYVDIYEPSHPLARRDGYVFEHRKQMWDAGALINPDHDVHHVNEVKIDNSAANLKAKTKAEHALEHAEERGWVTNQYGVWPVKPRHRRASAPRPVRHCGFCGQRIPDTKRRNAKFCNQACKQAQFRRLNPGRSHRRLSLADLSFTPAQRPPVESGCMEETCKGLAVADRAPDSDSS